MKSSIFWRWNSHLRLRIFNLWYMFFGNTWKTGFHVKCWFSWIYCRLMALIQIQSVMLAGSASKMYCGRKCESERCWTGPLKVTTLSWSKRSTRLRLQLLTSILSIVVMSAKLSISRCKNASRKRWIHDHINLASVSIRINAEVRYLWIGRCILRTWEILQKWQCGLLRWVSVMENVLECLGRTVLAKQPRSICLVIYNLLIWNRILNKTILRSFTLFRKLEHLLNTLLRYAVSSWLHSTDVWDCANRRLRHSAGYGSNLHPHGGLSPGLPVRWASVQANVSWYRS